jgi:hypothetical protein
VIFHSYVSYQRVSGFKWIASGVTRVVYIVMQQLFVILIGLCDLYMVYS